MKWDVQATEEYEVMLSRIGDEKFVRSTANKAIYKAAGMVTDALRASISQLSVVQDYENINNWRAGRKSKLSTFQRKGLLEGIGISKFKVTNGYINTKIGFDGYNGIQTRKYPWGQPNALIARMVEGGGSTFEAQPFISKTVTAIKPSAVHAMGVVIDEAIAQRTIL